MNRDRRAYLISQGHIYNRLLVTRPSSPDHQLPDEVRWWQIKRR